MFIKKSHIDRRKKEEKLPPSPLWKTRLKIPLHIIINYPPLSLQILRNSHINQRKKERKLPTTAIMKIIY
jgi:hypothetical protein